jgi:predicted dehydrogenase
MAQKTVRVGVVGTGGIARAQITALKKIANVEITALADIRLEACEQVKKDLDLPAAKALKSWQELVKLPDVDAVTVCTPNGMHRDPVVAALKAGKHAMVEKPIGMNAKEGREMCDAAKKARKVFTIGFQQRFRPDVQFVTRCVKDGVLGDIVYCRTQWLRRRGIPSWGVFGRKDLQGGGPMIDIGVHALDMAHYIAGRPAPIAASGSCYTYLGNKKPEATPPWGEWDWKTYTVEDLAVGFVRFKGGLTMTVESSFAAHIQEESFSIQIMGTKGGALIGGPDKVKVFTDMSGKMVNITPSFLPNDDCFAVKMQKWIAVIRGEEKNDAPGEDGLMIQKILDAIYLSSEKGCEVKIK